ncbi:Mu-like prophage tail protein gpP [Burkholderia diffusa]|uniref:phage baseplate assembly protein n=1 Tax=Burkholderia diffusa TaxID=488732 RepID=UPI001CAE31C0|nr:contractile injection system protein, VgrG/Pvc8 family [Burkholderia diffusa]CAG9248584.1 Mu-like prophage tail protein gpP [Burkholderia diffusa]
MDDVTLTIGGQRVAGWTAIRITRGMERIPADFDIGLTQRYPNTVDVSVNEGDPCILSIDDDTVITGYVDRVTEQVDAHQHALSVSGRGKCADIVDCSAQFDSFQFQDISTADIAAALCAPFNIHVKARVPGMIHPQVCLNVGETPYAVIDRLCKVAQLLCYEDADGDLVIGPLSTDEAAGGFTLGVNVERAGYVRDMSQRFSEYRVYLVGTGIMTDIGQQPLAEYVVADDLTPRYRPKAFIAETGDAGASVSNAHALWECNRRIGRGNVITVTASSWRDSAGVLYTPNTLAALSLSRLKLLDGQKFTIGEVTYRRDMGGTGCDLTLMPPQAFQPEPILYLPLPADAAAALGQT